MLYKVLVSLSGAIQNSIDYIIFVGFIVILALIIKRYVELRNFKTNKASLLKGHKKTSFKKEGNYVKALEETEGFRGDYYDIKKDYDDLVTHCDALSDLIPIFPLLGILGTVASLIFVVDTSSVAEILNHLKPALTSTLSGLISAIILKFIDTLCVQKEISQIDSILDAYTTMYEDVNRNSKTEGQPE